MVSTRAGRPGDRGIPGDTSFDVLVVGAGPTGLALTERLTAFGVSVMLVDLKAGPVPESRALALQPRTLEVLRHSVTDRLLERGNRAVRLQWHAADRVATLPLFDLGMDDTAYPFLLFLSQAETERALVDHLALHGANVHWNTRLVRYAPGPDGHLVCELLETTGRRDLVEARYVVGCDGAHSTVREQAGIAFTGGRYAQTFLLADADADGLAPDTAHVWFGANGPLFFFPLLRPAAWRLLTPRLGGDGPPPPGLEAGGEAAQSGPVDLDELQATVDAATRGTVRLATPVWSTAFRLHHRHADRYRAGSVLLAGDAAHIHSPAGAQGMNTGIQDAVNLGWKLALVCRGSADDRLLDTYDAERRPVGAFVVRFTDRAFTAATSTSPLIRFTRTHLVPRALALAGRLPRARAAAFRTVSQLDVRYPDTLGAGDQPRPGPGAPGAHAVLRQTPAPPHPWRRRPRPRPGERLPDVALPDGQDDQGRGQPRWFLDELTDTAFHLLLCGPASAWDEPALTAMTRRYGDLLRIHHVDETSPSVTARWGVRGAANLLVRPDGHLAHRREDTDLSGAARLLDFWLDR
jgi:2-polyprenyl-6-methoxyphenol hydroxylase-like FAD-dependent oxidoreductase